MNKLIEKAIVFAKEAHGNQKRKYSGEPYFVHPEAVAKIVAEKGGDYEMIAAAYLHDTIEDCDITYERILVEFGKRVADLVLELTDVYTSESYPTKNRAERKRLEAERLWKISDDAKMIKRADIKHNTSDIVANDADFAKVYLAEKEYILKGL